ncbi:MAG: cell division protein ZapE [Gammaproteobacteria bacterium]
MLINTVTQLYQADLAAGIIFPDPVQAIAVQHLQQVSTALVKKNKKKLGAIRHWCPFGKKKSVKGLYLWGTVGIGKTYLMDIFYRSLPFEKKRRQHFHGFMKEVHVALKQLQGHKNPLKLIAKDIAKNIHVLCFDEFFVSDIGDAMLLAGLLEALLQWGVTLVATSNCAPDRLYHNGLQRSLFLPAIQLLKNHCTIFEMVSTQDYRLRQLEEEGVYFYPLNEQSEEKIAKIFAMLAEEGVCEGGEIIVEGRSIKTQRKATNVIWFDFENICNIPRSQIDYLAIAQLFSTVIISNVPQISKNHTNAITYFIYLVDIFYDHRVNLIVSAEVPITDLYPEGEKAFEFQRTQSRLIEMQSCYYLYQQ